MAKGVYPHQPQQGFQKGHQVRVGAKLSPETREKIGQGNRGKSRSKKWRKMHSDRAKSLTGDKSPNWKGGVSKDRNRYRRERRLRKFKAGGFHTQVEWDLLKKQYGNKCPSCRRSEPKIVLTEDHIIPLSKGGSDFIENIQPLCRNCNSKKFTKIIKYGL